MSVLFSYSLYDAEIKQRVSEFLQQNEKILWLGKPASGSTFSPLLVALAVLLTVAGTSLIAGYWPMLPSVVFEQLPFMTFFAKKPLIPAVIITSAGLFLGATAWHRRPSQWAYAITDSRLLVVFGNKLLREKAPRQLKYLRITNRRGDRGDIYWQIRSGQHRGAYDEDGKSANRGPDGRYVGFKGQANAELLYTEILKWQKHALDSEIEVATASAEDYLSSADPVSANKKTYYSSRGGLTIRNRKLGFSVDVPAGWVTQVSQRKKGILPFLKISFLENIYRDAAFKPYAENLNWNLLITQGTAESWLEIYSTPGTLSTDWNTVINDPLAARFNQKVISQEPNLVLGEFTGFSITRSMSTGVTIRNYGITKTDIHIHMTWLSDGKLALEFRAIVPADSATLQQTVATIPTSLRMLDQ